MFTTKVDHRRLRPVEWLLLAVMAVLFAAVDSKVYAFQHPGIPLTIADLNAVKSNLNTLPWSDGYNALMADSRSQLAYTMQGPFGYVNRNLAGNYDNEWAWKNDMQAIFNLARMWYFTGNTNYAQKSHDILIAWANTMTNFNGIESALDLGDYAYRYGGGADILRGTWPGWTAADTLAVSNLFANVYWPATGAGNDEMGPSNKGALGVSGGLACAVFMDDTNKFNHCLYLYRTGASFGLNNNCLTSGEMGETGRDAGHGYDDLLQMAFLAEVFWKQGVDVYSEGDNRLLACGEYYARNNLPPPAAFIPYGTTDWLYLSNATNAGASSVGGVWIGEPMQGNILRSAYVLRKGLTTPWMVLKRATQSENQDSFCYLKDSDTSTAALPATITYPAAATVTTGLINTDIGGASPTGSGSYSGGIWTVKGGGTEIWTHNADSCHFVYKQVAGDCTIIAKVNSVQNTAATAKAGVMIRDSLSSSSANRAWVGVTAAQTAEFFLHGWTQVYGGSNWEKNSRALPQTNYWVKVERLGNMINLYTSLDGTSWACIGAGQFANMPSTTYIGLVVCSLNNGTLNTSAFSDVSITGGDGGNAIVPAAPYAIYASPDARQVPLRWLQSFGASSYNVMRSTTNGGPYAAIATVTNASYVDTNLAPNTTYYYVITASNSAGASAISPPDGATTQPPPPAPTGLTALAGNAQATLFWTPTGGAASYNLKRSTISGSGYMTLTNLTGISFVNSGLVNGTTYYYVVSATNTSGESTNSSEVSVTPGVAAGTTVIWSGAINTNWNINNTANWLSNGVAVNYLNGNSAQFDDTTSSNLVNVAINVSPAYILLNNSAKTYTFTSTGGSGIGGTGYVVKNGSAINVFNLANTYSGGTFINNGTITVGNNSALGTGIVTLNGGTINNNGGYTIANNIQASGSNNIQAVNGNNWTWNGNITGNGIIHQTVNGITSQVGLGGNNGGFSGTWIQDAGNTSLRFDSPNAGSASAAWVFNESQYSQRTRFNFGTGTINFGSMSGGAGSVGLANISSGPVVATLSVGGLNTSTTFAGTMEANGANGIIALTKVGTGTLTLTGPNAYTGLTTVSNGELIISTAFAGKGNFVVANGATLGITNLSTGSALVSNLTMAAGTTLEFQNATNPAVAALIASNLTLSGGCTVEITGTNIPAVGNLYPLISYAGNLNGSFANLQLLTPAGSSGVLVSNSHQIALAIVTIPAVPTNLLATAGDAQASLRWNSSAGATGYNLKRSTDGGATYNLIATVTATNYINTGLANGGAYYFVVSGLYSGGETADSAATSVVPVATTVPGLGMSSNGSQLQLFWPQDHTGWTLQIQTNSPNTGLGTNWVNITNSTATNQITIPIGTANSSVFFRLKYPNGI
ncbi:MAG: alginate lyase family protein [Verrucomicrobiae bacterium]|nr:alginate lyase family protein [Verrucomicrobiae bacterium]